MMRKDLEQIYRRIRAEEREALAQRVRDAYACAPELVLLEQERREIVQKTGGGQLSPADGVKRLDGIAARERALLAAHSLPPDTLQLHYRCPDCRDTGFTDEGKRVPCACSVRLRLPVDPMQQINRDETFESFRTDIYPDETQKKRTLNAKKLCEQYADALPRPEFPNLLLLGMPGLGKSFLANAIAARAVDRGVDGLRVTAYRFLSDILSDIRDGTKNADRYQNSALLVLDDLGSEPMIPKVSVEWLFAIVNERLMTGRATVIVTNLSLTGLQERYGERVMSRLSDRRTARIIPLSGSNLRW